MSMKTTGQAGDMRRLAARVLLGIVSAFLFLFVGEFVMRLAWNNPYTLEPSSDPYFRLHRPSLRATVSAGDLYTGGGKVQVATNEDRAISCGAENFETLAVALGGSTTESALVPEGGRWPDLVRGGARNFGVSGNTSIDSYWNLRYLIQSGDGSIETVFLTHAVNDVRAFLSGGAEGFTIKRWRQTPVDLFSIDNPDQRVGFGLTVRDSWLLSALRFADRETRGRKIFDAYSHNRDSQAHLEGLEDEAFQSLRLKFVEQFLPARERVMQQISEIAAAGDIRVVACSQPNSYRPDYRPFVRDLRLYPVVGQSRMTLEQAAEIMDLVNRQTLSIGSRYGWSTVDGAECFAGEEPGPLFYDSVHFTPAGSRVFAECVARSIID